MDGLNYNVPKEPKKVMVKQDNTPKSNTLKDLRFNYEDETGETKKASFRVKYYRDEKGYVNNILFKSPQYSFIMNNEPTKDGKDKYSYAWYDFKNKQTLHSPIEQTQRKKIGSNDKTLMNSLIEEGKDNNINEKISRTFIKKIFNYLNNNKQELIPIKTIREPKINNPQIQSRLYNPKRATDLEDAKILNSEILSLIMEDWDIKLMIDRLSSEETDPKTTYYMDNGRYYEFKSNIDLLELVNKTYGLDQSVYGRKDIMNALDSVYKSIEKNYDYIAFKNCFIDVKNKEKVDALDKPILPYLTHDVDYYETPTNIDEIIIDYIDTEFIQYLTTSLPPETKPDKTFDYKQTKWAMEILGYLLVSGNIEQVIFFIVGLGGTGKSVFLYIVDLIANHKTKACKIAKLCKQDKTDENVEVFDTLATIDADSSGVYIEDRTNLRIISGTDNVKVRMLYHNPITAKPYELGTLLFGGNVLPIFKKMETADYDRDFYLEFNVKFRGTKNQKENLKELLEKEKELIINLCLNMYLANGLSIKKEQTLEDKQFLYEKYSQPLTNALSELVTLSENKDVEEYVPVRELEDVILKYGETYNAPLNLNKKGRLKQGTLIRTIRKLFDLGENYESDLKEGKRAYNYLEPTELYRKLLKKIENKEEEDSSKN